MEQVLNYVKMAQEPLAQFCHGGSASTLSIARAIWIMHGPIASAPILGRQEWVKDDTVLDYLQIWFLQLEPTQADRSMRAAV
jgi:hypothetical protein